MSSPASAVEGSNRVVVLFQTTTILGQWSYSADAAPPPQLDGKMDATAWRRFLEAVHGTTSDFRILAGLMGVLIAGAWAVGLSVLALSITERPARETPAPSFMILAFPCIIGVFALVWYGWNQLDKRGHNVARDFAGDFSSAGCTLTYTSEVERRGKRRVKHAWFTVDVQQQPALPVAVGIPMQPVVAAAAVVPA